MKRDKTIYWTATGLLTLLMLFSVYNYFFNHEMIVRFFELLGYPTYLVYPLAIAKLLGLVAIHTKISSTLKEWAYAGFFFDTILAFWAHYMVQGAGYEMALGGVVFVLVSYIYEQKVFARKRF
jgi:hypothetical protein